MLGQDSLLDRWHDLAGVWSTLPDGTRDIPTADDIRKGVALWRTFPQLWQQETAKEYGHPSVALVQISLVENWVTDIICAELERRGIDSIPVRIANDLKWLILRQHGALVDFRRPWPDCLLDSRPKLDGGWIEAIGHSEVAIERLETAVEADRPLPWWRGESTGCAVCRKNNGQERGDGKVAGKPRLNKSQWRLLLVGALAKHHRWRTGEFNYDPATQAELMRLMSTPERKVKQYDVTRAMGHLLGCKNPMARYKAVCRSRKLTGFFSSGNEDDADDQDNG